MEHETSQNLIKVELTVKQLTSILINFDYLNKLAKERGKSLIAIKYSNDIEPFKKALNYTLAEDPRQFSAEECDLLYWANKFVNDPDAVKKIDEFFSYFNSANDTERGDGGFGSTGAQKIASVINFVRLYNVICFALKDAAFLNGRICCQREIYRKYFSLPGSLKLDSSLIQVFISNKTQQNIIFTESSWRELTGYDIPDEYKHCAIFTKGFLQFPNNEDPEYDSKIKLLQRMCSRFLEDLATTPKQIVLELEQDFGFIDLKNGEIVSLYFVARTQMTDLILPFKKRHDLFESLFYCQELLEEVMKIKTLSKLNKLRLQRILNSMNSIACLVPNPKALGVAK